MEKIACCIWSFSGVKSFDNIASKKQVFTMVRKRGVAQAADSPILSVY